VNRFKYTKTARVESKWLPHAKEPTAKDTLSTASVEYEVRTKHTLPSILTFAEVSIIFHYDSHQNVAGHRTNHQPIIRAVGAGVATDEGGE